MALPGQLGFPKVGDVYKVFLPGESPWAECVRVNADDTWEGKILNKLFHEHTADAQNAFLAETFGTAEPLPKLHDFKQDQIVKFKMEIAEDYEIFVPAESHVGTA